MLGGLGPLEKTWFTALLLLWAAFLFGGFLFGGLRSRRERRMPTWSRMASSAALTGAAWSWCIAAGEPVAQRFALLIAIGMSLGFLGDLLMARLLPLSQPVVAGIAAFGLGHVAYIAGGLIHGSSRGLTAAGPRFGAWAVWLLAGLAGWGFVIMRGQKPTALHWAALPYALLLSSTAGVATGLALQPGGRGLIPFAVGAALFLISDLTIAAHLFNDLHFRLMDDFIWLTYGPAQMLIVYSGIMRG